MGQIVVSEKVKPGPQGRRVMVARAGVQPATFALGVRRSMRLSYRASAV